MSTISLSTAMLGRKPTRVRQLGLLAVCLGVGAFGAGVVAAALNIPVLFAVGGYGAIGAGVALAGVHTYRHGGLLASWGLLFWPVAGAAAAAAFTGGVRQSAAIDALLGGALWGTLAAVGVGTVLFLLVRGVRWGRDGRLSL